ncbi:hypothetical protein [Streptomyces sp. 3213.3]|uniref:hypothetical protein n=1 Tax=Streptomyces sp. 3213.3 TaxID=1855348 RepID=UPI000AD8BF31|nr:hypothetical protein [Streptomyces sp. 3213.3]
MTVLGLGLLSPIAVQALKSPPAQGSSHRTSLVIPTAADRWTAPRPADLLARR